MSLGDFRQRICSDGSLTPSSVVVRVDFATTLAYKMLLFDGMTITSTSPSRPYSALVAKTREESSEHKRPSRHVRSVCGPEQLYSG